MEDQDIHGAILAVMKGLKSEGKSPKTLKTYETSFNSFEDYLEDNGIKFVDESMCLEYIYLKTGQRFDSFACVTSNSRVNYRMRPLSLLLYYLEMGISVTKCEIQNRNLSARQLLKLNMMLSVKN